MEASTIHTLLIGIDAYTDGLHPLFGCCNDIDAIQTLLTGSLGAPRATLTRLVSPHEGATDFEGVPGQPATRANIVEALRRLGREDVAPTDKVLIYYSGHGGSVRIGEHGGTLRESLVPVDVIIEATREVHNIILDVELIGLLRGITSRTEQVTLILDACHSAGAARSTFRYARDVRPRYADLRGFVRPDGVDGPSPGGIVRGVAGALEACVVAAACQADEVANEGLQGMELRSGGFFTSALLHVLAGMDRGALMELRWGQIWRQVVARVEARANQHPQLLGTLARKVFGGPIEHGDPGFDLRREGAGYRLSVGELAGVAKGTIVGVYSGLPVVLPPRGSVEELQVRLGTLKVIEARRGSSLAEPTDDTTLAQLSQATRAMILRPGKPSLAVAFDPPELLNEPLRAALAEATRLRIADAGEPASLVVKRCKDGRLALTDDLHGTGDEGDTPDLFRYPADLPPTRVRAVLEHYADYIAPVEFARRCEDPPGNLLRLNLLECTHLSHDENGFIDEPGFDPQDPQLPRIEPDQTGRCELVAGVTAYCVEVQNPGTRTLHVTWIECGASGRVYVHGKAAIPGRGRHVFWFDGSPGLPAIVDLPEGRLEILDRVIAIGTSVAGVDLGYLGLRSSFEDITRGDLYKDGVSRYPSKELWTSAQLVVRSRKP